MLYYALEEISNSPNFIVKLPIDFQIFKFVKINWNSTIFKVILAQKRPKFV